MSDNRNDDFEDNPWDESNQKETPQKKKQTSHQQFSNSGSNNMNQNNDFIDSIIKMLKKNNKSSIFGGRPPSKGPGHFASKAIFFASLAGALWLSTGFFRVQEGEVAVILRFGEMVRTSGPGLHYHLPSPIEQEIIRKVDVLNKIDSQSKTDSRSPESLERTLVLTGDENMIHINYTVLWNIGDISNYLFQAKDPEGTIIVAAESAIREILGQTSARAALTEERNAIEGKAQELLQKILNEYQIGINIKSVQLQKVEAPSQVINAFNDMQASLTDGDRMRNEAEAYRNEILPKARGQATQIIQEAEAYAQEVVAKAKGDAERFNSVYAEYKKNPEIARKRLYLDTMQKVLSNTPKTIIDGKASQNIVPYFQLQKSAKNTKSEGK